MLKKIDHIGIAVKDIDKVLNLYKDIFGLELEKIEVVKDQKVKIAFLPIGSSKLELLEPIDSKNPLANYIEKKGESIQHIAFSVNDIEKALEKLKQNGIKLIDETPRIGASGVKIAFIHPKSTYGVLIELCEQ